MVVMAEEAEMGETKISSMHQAGQVMATSDDETIFGLIENMALRSVNSLASRILAMSRIEHWTVQRTTLVLAYTFILRDEENFDRILEITNNSISPRPMIINNHCAGCSCEDKQPFTITEEARDGNGS